jgi:hypothetical protein
VEELERIIIITFCANSTALLSFEIADENYLLRKYENLLDVSEGHSKNTLEKTN